MSALRNLPAVHPQAFASLIDIRPNRVVSMSLSRSKHGSIMLLAFAEGEFVSEEVYPGDTLYQVLEGEMPLTMNGSTLLLNAGEVLLVPAGVSHAIGGTSAFKVMQLTLNE